MARVSKWGNSLAVRLPKKVVEMLELKEGDEVNLGVQEGSPPGFEISRAERVEQAILNLRKYRGRLPDDFKFDREPLGKMLRDLESQLRPEQIVGGPAESLTS